MSSYLNQIKKWISNKLVKRGYFSLHKNEIENLVGQLESFALNQKTPAFLINQFDSVSCDAENFEKVENLKNKWADIEPFHSKSLQDVITLNEFAVKPLEILLLKAINEIDSDLKYIEEFGLWRPKWLLDSKRENLDGLNSRLASLTLYQARIAKSVVARLDITENAQDNPLKNISSKLKEIDSSASMGLEGQLNAALSDDDRVYLYDWLSRILPSSKSQFDTILSPVRKKVPHIAADNLSRDKAKKEFHSLIDRIEKENNLTAMSDLKQRRREQENLDANLKQSIASKMLQYLIGSSLVRLMRALYKARHFVALAFTLCSWFLLAPILSLTITSYVGASISSYITQFVFWSVVLSPLYVLVIDSTIAFFNRVSNSILYNKKQELHENLETLKLNQLILSTRIEPNIIDVAHYNFDLLTKQIDSLLMKDSDIEAKIETLGFWEKLFSKVAFKASLKETKDLAAEQRTSTLIALKSLSKNILQGYKHDSQKLMAHGTKKLMAFIPKDQYQKIESFISKFGDSSDLKSLQQAASLLPQLTKSLTKGELRAKNQNAYQGIPWGGFKPLFPAIIGWEHLMQNLTNPEGKSFACLMAILRGSEKVFEGNYRALLESFPEELRQPIASSLSQHIFLCLSEKHCENVHLLSAAHKKEIATWYLQNKDAILELEKSLQEILGEKNTFSYQALSDFLISRKNALDLLDGATIYHMSTNQVVRFGTTIRSLIDSYKGESSDIFLLARYLPQNERGGLVSQIASKRIDWLMNNPSRDSFTNRDIELFQSAHHLQAGSFNLREKIIRHPSFTGIWDEKIATLLKRVTHAGLDTGVLLELYTKANAQMHQYKRFSNRDSCGMSVETSISAVGRAIYAH